MGKGDSTTANSLDVGKTNFEKRTKPSTIPHDHGCAPERRSIVHVPHLVFDRGELHCVTENQEVCSSVQQALVNRSGVQWVVNRSRGKDPQPG